MKGFSLKEERALMTLEATIIIPFCLIASLLLIWTGMLLYNRSAVDYALSVACIQAARNAEAENDEILAFAQEKAEELLLGKLVMMDTPQLAVSVSATEVSAQLSGSMKSPPLLSVGGSSFSFSWDVTCKKSSPRLKESMIVRSLHMVF